MAAPAGSSTSKVVLPERGSRRCVRRRVGDRSRSPRFSRSGPTASMFHVKHGGESGRPVRRRPGSCGPRPEPRGNLVATSASSGAAGPAVLGAMRSPRRPPVVTPCLLPAAPAPRPRPRAASPTGVDPADVAATPGERHRASMFHVKHGGQPRLPVVPRLRRCFTWNTTPGSAPLDRLLHQSSEQRAEVGPLGGRGHRQQRHLGQAG